MLHSYFTNIRLTNFHINASEEVNIPNSVQEMHFHYGRERIRDEEEGGGKAPGCMCIFKTANHPTPAGE
jgi:hypothetical protein